MENLEELTNLAKQVDRILREELETASIEYEMAEARMYNVKTVGVQGDARTYLYPAEITLWDKEGFVWNLDFIRRLETRILNELREHINRVVYVIRIKE